MSKYKRLNISVDVESDGPCPGEYSMVSFGAVVVEDLNKTFYGQTAPLVKENYMRAAYIPEALAVSGHTRDEHILFDEPKEVMAEFVEWIENLDADHVVFWSDNNGFDWQFMNYYLHRFTKGNPFGWSSRNISDLYRGLKGNMRANFRKLRTTKHTHHPVDDAKGNAEALIKISDKYDLRIYEKGVTL